MIGYMQGNAIHCSMCDDYFAGKLRIFIRINGQAAFIVCP